MTLIDASGHYTADAIARIAAEQLCSIEALSRRWIISRGDAHAVLAPGGYLSTVSTSDLEVSIARDLAAVPPSSRSPAGIDWTVVVGDSARRKTLAEIRRDHSTVARQHHYSYTGVSRYAAATQTLIERVAPLRHVAAQYSEQVDTWLRLLFGSLAEKALDWSATSVDLSRPTCAITLVGPPGVGKNLFAHAISRQWTTLGPAPGRVLVDPWTDPLLSRPLIHIDERMPEGLHSADVRRLVGESVHPIRRRHRPETTLDGCPRLLVTANHLDILGFDNETFVGDDITAIAQRILFVRADGRAAEYLSAIGGRDLTERWLSDDIVTSHIAWLRETRTVARGSRFLVGGEIADAHRRLATSGRLRSLIVEFVIGALTKPHSSWRGPVVPAHAPRDPRLRIGDGQIFVNAKYVQENWTSIITGDQRAPSLRAIGSALRGLAGSSAVERRIAGADHWAIPADLIVDTASELQLAPADELRQILDGVIAPPPPPPPPLPAAASAAASPPRG